MVDMPFARCRAERRVVVSVPTQLEDYGFCNKGGGGAFASFWRIAIRRHVNTSGRQLSEAYVESMLQIVEGARQLQGVYAADRQAPGAEIARVSGHGGYYACYSTLILGKI
jgi:hypothetical protein